MNHFKVYNPTYNAQERTLEVHMLDFNEDIYGEDLRVELTKEFGKRDVDQINSALRASGVTYGFIGKITECKTDDIKSKCPGQ